MRFVTYSRAEDGPRCHILGHRLHHGLAGAVVTIASLITAAVGIGLVADDIKDLRRWIPDLLHDVLP